MKQTWMTSPPLYAVVSKLAAENLYKFILYLATPSEKTKNNRILTGIFYLYDFNENNVKNIKQK